MMTTVFVGWFMHKSTVEEVVNNNLGYFFNTWYVIVKYIAPVALILVMFGLIGII
jgi:SNF family Na+-dependent transporter